MLLSKYKQKWKFVVDQFCDEYFDELYYFYLSDSYLSKVINNNHFLIIVNTKFKKEYLNEEVKPKLQKKWHSIYNESIYCDFILSDDVPTQGKSIVNSFSDEKESLKYTFDNYMVNKSNSIVCDAFYEIADCVIEDKFKLWQPFIIYSKNSLGKTHLLKAFVKKIKKNNKKVIFYNGFDFATNISKIFSKKSDDHILTFKQRFLEYDVLVFDNLEEIEHKEKTAEIFYNILCLLLENNKQIILSSTNKPSDSDGYSEKLISKFNFGVSVELPFPDEPLLKKIIKNKFKIFNDKIKVSEEVINFLSTLFTNNITVIEGIVKNIIFYSILYKNFNPNLEDVKKIITKDKILKINKKNINYEQIVEAVAEEFYLTKENIYSRKRAKNFIIPRYISVYLIRELLSFTFIKISKIFNKKDHTSVLSSYNIIKSKIETDLLLKNKIKSLKEKILKI